ncbi:hypothetical protein BU26DRAFT_491017 [Trematosphaeria pertusa]|uniref:Wax synthase domain-containing protein n=1 Tax=Trematosphaeria pertusa TaxID=390896 RepID=A0A6A6I333_9PLEO|nr:uncharacterized protein BU26DRAFT_491017 [Trematosphaeria pertusa]KAF2244895.1 hypothetical protein BU26DRAFT_491017 [Trematosphaeria pertusa]
MTWQSVPLVLATVVAATLGQADASTFRPNCTLPLTTDNLVLSAGVRGTFDILWSSIFTLLICSWSILHLNIPSQLPRLQKSMWDKIKSYAVDFLPKFKWMVLTLLVPEFLLGKALQDRHLAKVSIDEMKELASESGFEWTITHGFYADMGGFVLKAHTTVQDQATPTPVVLNLRSLQYACGEMRMIERLPRITEDEIKDKSKGDFFVKCLTGMQLAWFVIQVITRASKGLAISALEIAILAYAACSLITLYLCLSKPKDVKIEVRRPQSWFDVSLQLARYRGRFGSSKAITSPIPNDARYAHGAAASAIFPGVLLTRMDDGFTIAGIVFGGIHCAAWNFAFPSPVERLLWRISSVGTAGVLPLYYALLLADIHLRRFSILRVVLPVLEFLVGLSYLLARLYLLVEVFRELFFLPPSAFISTWTAQFPHVS